MTEKELYLLYRTAITADDAWHSELIAVYGDAASDARYDPKRYAATPKLDDLAAAKIEADLAWLNALAATREKGAMA
jgi:hypothetical protein